MRESFWKNNSLVTHILFEICLLWYLVQLQIWCITLYESLNSYKFLDQSDSLWWKNSTWPTVNFVLQIGQKILENSGLQIWNWVVRFGEQDCRIKILTKLNLPEFDFRENIRWTSQYESVIIKYFCVACVHYRFFATVMVHQIQWRLTFDGQKTILTYKQPHSDFYHNNTVTHFDEFLRKTL